MAESLEADVQLDIGDALGRVETIRAALEAAVTGAPPAQIDADTTAVAPAIEGAIGAGSAVPAAIDADATAIAPAIEGAIADAPADVPLDVDSSSLQEASSHVEQLSADLGEADEQAGALGFSFEQIKGAAAAVGLALSVRQVTGFVRDAVGAARDEVETLNKASEVFGRFNAQIVEFGETSATSVGLGDDAAIEFAATLGNLFTSMGLTRKASADMSIGMVELAADVGSFNNLPTDDVLNRLRAGLIGQVRPLRQLGISFDATEVSAKAVTLGLVEQGEELTEVEKIQARYAIILDKSKNAQGDFARTSGDLANLTKTLTAEFGDAQDTLGARLIPSVTDLAQTARAQLVPALLEVGDPLFRMAAAALETGNATGGVMLTGLRSVVPLLELTATVVEALPPELLSAALNAALLGRAFGPLGATLGIIAPLLEMLPGGVGAAAVSMGFAALAGGKLAGVLPNVSKGLGAAALGAAALGQAIGGTEGQAVSLGATGGLVAASFGAGPWGIAAGVVLGVGAALLSAGENAEKTNERVAALADQINELGETRSVAAFLESTGNGFNLMKGDIENITIELRRLARESPEAGKRVAEGLRTSELAMNLTKAQQNELNLAVKRGTDDFQRHAQSAADAKATNDQYATSATQAAEAEAKAAEQLKAFADAAVAGLPAAAGVLDQTATALGKFGLGLDSAASPEAFLADLQATTASIVNFQSTIQGLLDRGLDNVAALVVSKGPVIGGAFGAAVLSGNEATATTLDQQLGIYQGAVDGIDTFLRGPAAAQLSGGYKATVDTWGALAGGAASVDVPAAIDAGTPVAMAAGKRHGKATGAAVEGGFKETAPQGIAAGARLADAALSQIVRMVLNVTARIAGSDVGISFVSGMRIAILQRAQPGGILEQAGIAAAKAVERGARNAGSPSEHLFYDAASMWPVAMADAMRDGSAAVVAEAEALTRAAALGLPLPSGGIGGISGGGVTSAAGLVSIDTIKVEVNGALTESQGRAAGDAIAGGIVSGLERRRVVVTARGGSGRG